MLQKDPKITGPVREVVATRTEQVLYPDSVPSTRDLRSTMSRLGSTASEKQEQSTHRSQPVWAPGSRPLKALASSSDGITTIVSPDGEILRRVPPETTTSIEWFIREESKRLNYPRHGERWDDAEDRLLGERVTAEATVSQLAAHHQRIPGGIKSR